MYEVNAKLHWKDVMRNLYFNMRSKKAKLCEVDAIFAVPAFLFSRGSRPIMQSLYYFAYF